MQNNQSQKSSEPNIPSAHTYTEDMAKMMHDNEASVIKSALAEKRRREQEALKIQNRKGKGRNILFTLGSIALIFAAIYALQTINYKTKVDSVHPQVADKFKTLIPSDKQIIIPADNFFSENDIAQAIAKEKAVASSASSVRSILLTKGTGDTQTVLNSNEFLTLIQSSIPSSIKKSLSGSMMTGIYTDSSATPKAHTFFIFQINDYGSAYAGSIAWEKTLLTEFYPLFGIDISGSNASLLQKTFDDGLLNNKNVRVLNDANNNPILYSVFIDNNYYMLTDSPDAITEMTSRLHTMNTKPL